MANSSYLRWWKCLELFRLYSQENRWSRFQLTSHYYSVQWVSIYIKWKRIRRCYAKFEKWNGRRWVSNKKYMPLNISPSDSYYYIKACNSITLIVQLIERIFWNYHFWMHFKWDIIFDWLCLYSAQILMSQQNKQVIDPECVQVTILDNRWWSCCLAINLTIGWGLSYCIYIKGNSNVQS